jgi:TPR repeat protein
MARAVKTAFINWAREPDPKELTAASLMLAVNPAEAYSRLRTLAERGSITSMAYIGDVHRFGIGSPIDLEEAEKWYRQAADKGSLIALYDLATLYLATKRDGEARPLLRIAASRALSHLIES